MISSSIGACEGNKIREITPCHILYLIVIFKKAFRQIGEDTIVPESQFSV